LCVNTDLAEIPAGGCVRISAVNGASSKNEIKYTAVKPDGEPLFYFFNGAVPVAAGKTFSVDMPSRITRALVDGYAVPFGETVGPVDGSWTMDETGSGFAVIGDTGADGLTPVMRLSTGGGGDQIGFDVTDANCEEGTVSTDLESILRYTGCDIPPGAESYGGGYVIEDFIGLIGAYTEEELLAARGVAIYWNDYPACTGHWDLLLLTWTGGC